MKAENEIIDFNDVKDEINEYIEKYDIWCNKWNEHRSWNWDEEIILRKQKEISFKAGIKEVVNWINLHREEQDAEDLWKVKLKEWGITS